MTRFPLALRARHHPYDRPGEPVTHFSVIAEDETVGTIYKRTNLAGDDAPWFWAVTIVLAMAAERTVATSGREASREEAMQAFRRGYEAVRSAIGEDGWTRFTAHCRALRERDAAAQARKEGRD